jgi:hypothetical protein
MPSPKSHRVKLAERMAELFRQGLFVQFRCEPTAVGSNKTVRATAVFFAPSTSTLPNIKPIVHCEQNPKFAVYLNEDPPRSTKHMRTFRGELDLAGLGVENQSLTLTLHPDAKNFPVARARVHLFDDLDTVKAQEQLRQH